VGRKVLTYQEIDIYLSISLRTVVVPWFSTNPVVAITLLSMLPIVVVVRIAAHSRDVID
jgi:hypothetical protein